jgi:uncharacterized protein (TIGR02680 family)
VSTERFKPVRAGIIGVWDYVEQEFRFADGHLVLRGPNGSGKTKALEVLVPFVLDGSIDARRLDPFSGQERTMRSNLLYGGDKARHGYCWLEFARGDEHVTLGVGLRAQAQSQDVKRWFFLADGVVGESIRLLTPERVPVTEKELRAQIGDACVVKEREQHRAAVDRRLFDLGPERYAAMLDLVLTLRRPQLAKDLDPERLSSVLSEGLRTVDRDLLRTSAVAFDNLEAAQRELSDLERAAEAVSDLLVHWRTYLRARARRRVEDVREREGRVGATRRRIAEAERAIARHAEEVAAARQRARAAASERDAHQARLDALKARDAYQNRGQLDDARQAAELAQGASFTAQSVYVRARTALDTAAEDELATRRRRDQAAESARERATALRIQCASAGHRLEEPVEVDAVRAWLVARGASVRAVLALVEALEGAVRKVSSTQQQREEAATAFEDAARSLRETEEALAASLEEAEALATGWHADLPVALREALSLETLRTALPDLGGEVDLSATVKDAWSALRDRTLDERNRAHARVRERADAIARLDQALEAIRAQRDDAPPVPPTRRAERDGRAGAPLWRLVRFCDDVSPEDQAGLEGALLAAGLLDAWLDPHGGLTPREDTHLLPTSPAPGPSLADVLVPEAEAAVPAERLVALLASVSLAAADVAVTPDGHFRLGPLAGAHRPEQARYIGATARARHRAERVALLERERDEHEAARRAAEDEAGRCTALLVAMGRAIEALPDPVPARKARARRHAAEGGVRQAERGLVHAESALATAQRARGETERRVRQGAAEHGVPAEPDEVRALERHVRSAREALAEHLHAAQHLATCQESLDRATTQRAACQAEHARAGAERDEAEARYQAQVARHSALMESLGAEVQLIARALEEAAGLRNAAERQRAAADEAARDAELAHAKREGAVFEARRELPEQEDDLARARASLAPFEHLDVQAVLVPEGEAPFDERLATAVEGASFTEEQLKTTETRLSKRLAGIDVELGTRFHSVYTTDDGIVVIAMADELGEHGLGRFESRLRDRLEVARHLLDHHEQRLFEDHLLGTLCGQLRERINGTAELVRSMDEAMRERRLASQKSVGIDWRPVPEADAARKELLSLLRYDARFLTTERLARVRELLSSEVQAARRERPDRSYVEILDEALDYRSWYAFELTLIDAAGASTRLTRRAHGRLSGGEKAATVHLPLFAAAHAHFSAAKASCPRLVALDEAFAGIDETGVPELLRLAHAFDLDWFLTGHDLWVTEPFLKGVMHYDLAHDPVSRAISAWPILWNGHETVEGDEVGA